MSIVSYHGILKYLVFDLAHHEVPIARWSERPTENLECHGFDFCWVLRNFFLKYFNLKNTSPLFILNPSHQSIYQF